MSTISAIILAAGKSIRMRQQKMLMPWGNTTVLQKVIHTIQKSVILDIVVITNSEIALEAMKYGVQIEINNDGEMLTSLQLGLLAQKSSAKAVLICLGDQPQIEERSVRSVCEAFQKSGSNLVVPSFKLRRGHPWLVSRELWAEIVSIQDGTMRDFMNAHTKDIEYVNLDTPSILQDLDTPEDYLKYKPPM